MKHNVLSAALSLSMLTAMGQVEKVTDSKITGVTVFLNSAQVMREASARVEAGKTNLIIAGLTSQLDPQSIQVTGKGSIVILGISHRQNFLNEFNVPKALKLLMDSLEQLQKQVILEQSQKEILNKEEAMLLTNQKIGGTTQNLTVAELKAMADFYRTRLGEIVTARMRQDEKIKKINERIAKLQQQINNQNELYSRNTSEIVVSVSAEAPTPVELEVNYIVANAGWYPVYDLRAINTKKPIQLSYKANVQQATGEDWKNVKLKLSTANPNLSGLKPELNAWYLNFNVPIEYAVQGRAAGVAMKRNMDAAAPVMAEEKAMAPAETSAEYVRTIQTTLNTEFDISLPYTVASSSKPTLVDIRNYEVKADYLYSTAPKLDNDAFLLAKATGWEEYSLLPGDANIFFEGTFVGKTFIDPNSIKDTLTVSLGRDKRIVVKREKLKELTSRKLIGTNQRESYAWEISVRNTKAEAIKVIVEDQVPVSQNNQIEVSGVDVGGAKYNKDTGKLIWELTLQPNETKKIVFKYEVKYPKDKPVNGL
jgi:uncharacterized protein (TIGR02231 family)